MFKKITVTANLLFNSSHDIPLVVKKSTVFQLRHSSLVVKFILVKFAFASKQSR